MLKITGVEKDFGGIKAVNDCSIHVERGRITGLIGPNGAGKTTLFDLISGVQKPDMGQIHLDGENITDHTPHQIFDSGLIRTFQVSRELGNMSLLENLMLIPPAPNRGGSFQLLFLSRKSGRRGRKKPGPSH